MFSKEPILSMTSIIRFLPLLVLFSCTSISGDSNELGSKKSNDFEFKKDNELSQIIPEPPVKIKLKRSWKGDYSWELTGNTEKRIVEINRLLEEELGDKNQ